MASCLVFHHAQTSATTGRLLMLLCSSFQLFHLIYSQHDLVKQLAKLAGWQDTLTKLYVKESYESRQHSLSGSANSGGCLDLLKISDQPGAEMGRESMDLVNPSATDLQDLDVFLPLGYETPDQDLSEGFSDHSISPTNQRSKSFHPYGFKSFDSLDLASHSSSSIIDFPGQGEAQAGDTFQADRTYHPLSPFSVSPFDLGLDLGSTTSVATGESGNQTPVSLPGTPSPLENFKPFPGTRVRKSSSLSNVLDETSNQETLPSDSISNASNPQVSFLLFFLVAGLAPCSTIASLRLGTHKEGCLQNWSFFDGI